LGFEKGMSPPIHSKDLVSGTAPSVATAELSLEPYETDQPKVTKIVRRTKKTSDESQKSPSDNKHAGDVLADLEKRGYMHFSFQDKLQLFRNPENNHCLTLVDKKSFGFYDQDLYMITSHKLYKYEPFEHAGKHYFRRILPSKTDPTLFKIIEEDIHSGEILDEFFKGYSFVGHWNTDTNSLVTKPPLVEGESDEEQDEDVQDDDEDMLSDEVYKKRIADFLASASGDSSESSSESEESDSEADSSSSSESESDGESD
jgi:hypothetical protein